MHRYAVVLLILLCLAGVTCAATTVVVVNGQVVPIAALEANGKVFVDPVALMQLLGGKATYLPANHKVMIRLGGAAGEAALTTPQADNWGTPQMPGENGQLGQVYSICKRAPLYLRLNSAEFTTNQVVIGEQMYSPSAEQKLIVLHFSVQNPAKEERLARGDVLKLTVVDQMNVNHVGQTCWGDEQNHQLVNLQLKPAQRLDAYAVVVVPAKGTIPKLIVESAFDNGAPVLRYDLRGKIKSLQPPVADANDAGGATALETVPAVFGMACAMTDFVVTLEKTDYVTTALGDEQPPDGGRFLTATLLFKCVAPRGSTVRYDRVQPVLTDADGVQLVQVNKMIGAGSDRSVSQDVKQGQEMRVRIYFAVPKGATAKTLILGQGDSRKYQFEIPE